MKLSMKTAFKKTKLTQKQNEIAKNRINVANIYQDVNISETYFTNLISPCKI